MLPSTGYFNGINCPFYENGPCDRPYCHFRHARKDLQNTTNDGIESGAILQKLVSAAVQRVLQQTEVSITTAPQAAVINTIADSNKPNILSSTAKATYNPTPIAELNKINNTDTENNEEVNEQRKRHIPVPYTPRKPASTPIIRPVDTNGSSKPFIYIPPPLKYTPGSTESAPNDKYTPSGAVESKEKYLPGTEKELPEYTPDPTSQDTSNKRNYVPSTEKTINKKKVLEYKPSNPTKTNKSSVTYQPTPRSLAPCFSSDEEEPESKKLKLSTDLNGLDDLGPEFDILDQILDEENTVDDIKMKTEKDPTKSKSKHSISDSKEKNGDASKSEKDKQRSHHKSKSDKKGKSTSEDKKEKSSLDDRKEKSSSDSKDRKEKVSSEDKDKKVKSSSENKDKKENKHKSNDKKSHKSSSRDKEKDQKHSKINERESKDKEKDRKESKDKHSHDTDKKRHSSKNSDDSHKHSKNPSKKKEKHSNSKSSHSDLKHKEKRSKEKEKRHKNKHNEEKKSKKITSYVSDNEDLGEENGNFGEDDYYSSDADEDTIAMECKKIFEEYVPIEPPKLPEESHKAENITEDYIPSKKRVSRTVDKNIKVIPKAPIKPDFKVNAAQAMSDRLAKVREFHNSRQPPSPIPPTNTENPCVKTDLIRNNPSATTTTSKIRIAHVPYASTMLYSKKTITPSQTKTMIQPSTSSTICQTVKKGVQRVAHIPNEKFIDRPGVLEPLASKIAANIRSIYLNMMIDECLKLYISSTDAYARAQHEELNTSKKCSTVQIYKNSAVLAVSRLRKELQECNGVKKTAASCSVIGSDSSSKSNAGSWSIESKNRKVIDNSQEFIGAKFYKNISKWVLTEELLQSNGFPRPHTSGEKGRAIIYGQNKQHPPKGYLRTCCRCKKEYTVTKKGFAAVVEECIYHPNRIYRVRGEAKYQCCSQDATSDGCCVAPCHVYEYVDYENLKGYVRTLPPERQMDDYGVYSLDCEMCYTTQGLDLTRVTVINSSCKVIYETLVRPLHPIIDYNTRYSGITEEQMTNVRTTLLEVQATLLAMFSSKTILVGHSLESDFKALKLIHDTVVDTSVLFPHKMGPPYKRALRNLSSENLKKIIQNSVDGHDSAEDAMVCMELLHYKLKEELKTR